MCFDCDAGCCDWFLDLVLGICLLACAFSLDVFGLDLAWILRLAVVDCCWVIWLVLAGLTAWLGCRIALQVERWVWGLWFGGLTVDVFWCYVDAGGFAAVVCWVMLLCLCLRLFIIRLLVFRLMVI